MKAIIVGPEPDFPLNWTEVETPVPASGEVRIRVHATAVNRADLLQRRGLYPPPPGASPILGLECAGIIDAVGEGVAQERIGERVCALLSGGGYAEYAVCPADHAVPIPNSITFEQAASIPEVWSTAWLKLIDEGHLTEGEKVLIHAGASGVGSVAIQLCGLFRASCFVTVGNANKLKYCLNLGASDGAIRHDGPWNTKLHKWAPSGVSLILDPVGADYLQANLSALETGGRLIVMGLLGGRKAEVDLGRLLVKRLRIVGSTLRSRSEKEKAALMNHVAKEVIPRLGSGEFVFTIYKKLPITDAESAHRQIRWNENLGKVVLLVR